MDALEKDIENAILLSKCQYEGKAMTEYSKIYQNTTENIKEYMPYFDRNYKNALLPTSSGDHHLEAILNGVNNIISYDINRLAKYYTELKFAAIKNFTRDEFIKFMYEDTLNKKMFEFLKNSLSDDVEAFWIELYKHSYLKNIRKNLFRYLGIEINGKTITGIAFSKYCSEQFVSYLNTGNYKLVQERLCNAKIKYIESDISNLSEKIEEKVDIINLTNIYEFINKYIIHHGAEDFSEIVKSLIPILSDDGTMLITYLYRCSQKDVKRYGKKGMLYINILNEISKNPDLNELIDEHAKNENKKTILDKMYAFRNTQLLRYIKELNIEKIEINGTGLGMGLGEKDMVLLYKKL